MGASLLSHVASAWQLAINAADRKQNHCRPTTTEAPASPVHWPRSTQPGPCHEAHGMTALWLAGLR